MMQPQIRGPIPGMDDRDEACYDVRMRVNKNYEANLIKQDFTKADRKAIKEKGFDQTLSCERCLQTDFSKGMKYVKPLEEYKTLNFVKHAFVENVNRSLHIKEGVHYFDYKCSVCGGGKSFSFKEEEIKNLKLPGDDFVQKDFTKIAMYDKGWKQLAENLYIKKSKVVSKFKVDLFDVAVRCISCGKFTEVYGASITPQNTLVKFECDCGDHFAHNLDKFIKSELATMSFKDMV